MTISTSTDALVTAVNSYGSAVIARRKAGGQITGPLYTKPTVVAFSTTPAFDAATSNVFEFGLLTNNVPGATVINGADGQTIRIRFQQDATGNRTFTVPGNCQVQGAIAAAANSITWLVLTYNGPATKWEGRFEPAQ